MHWTRHMGRIPISAASTLLRNGNTALFGHIWAPYFRGSEGLTVAVHGCLIATLRETQEIVIKVLRSVPFRHGGFPSRKPRPK